VVGHLDGRWGEWFGDMTIIHNEDGTTTLFGPVADQARLHGMLAGIRDVGATLVSLQASEHWAPSDSSRPSERVGASHHSIPSHAAVARPCPVLDRPLQTERLTIRPATASDAEPTWRFRQLEPVHRWLTGAPADLDAYSTIFSDPARLAITAVLELTGYPGHALIGDLMLKREDAWAQTDVADLARGTQAELGWVLDPAYTGHGYATEAVRELLRHCFDDLGLRRVVANCFLDNHTSWRLMERVGMRRETHAKHDALHRSGKWLDSLAYAILAEEWASARTT
jgi:RimJ/RimL family protein N-acetyltransferase